MNATDIVPQYLDIMGQYPFFSVHNRKLRLIFVNFCEHSYNKYICYHDNLHACKGTRRFLFFYATFRSAISWEVPVLNQCTSDKKMLIFSYISLVSRCLFSMIDRLEVRIFLLFKRSMTTYFSTPYYLLKRGRKETEASV